ncbi:MAG TPA: ATP-binding protein [Minicystis sp.]|nr:ATP-binding protein [Minicystis sp.]
MLRPGDVEPRAQLSELIRQRAAAILARWEQEVRSRAIARALSRPALLDSMPEFIEQLARAAEHGDPPDRPVERLALEHAQQRLELGYELGQLVAEYGALRIALIDEVNDVAAEIPLSAFRPLNAAIEQAVADVVRRFSAARARKLRALERISGDVLSAPDLEQLLFEVIDVLAETVPQVDEVTVLLREDGELRVRATRGLEEELARGFTVAVGTGFAGAVAASRQPLLLRDAANDPLVKSDVLRSLGVRALYGVPLVDAGELVGVAHMGSRRAFEFPEEDMILFRAVANRATAIIATRSALERERRIEALREQFIAVLGHDLRAPLQAILGSTQLLLKRGRLDEHDAKSVARVARAAERMSRLTTDVLDFARSRLGGGMPLVISDADLVEVARTACEEAELAFAGREVALSAPSSLPVRCDADRVAQLVSNLVANALKHGAPDAPVTVTVADGPGVATIAVHNDGAPIPDELLPNMFEPFRQGERRGSHGIGLGLYIAKEIVVAHGGSIEVRSRAGEGTTFTAHIPKAARAPARDAPST